VTNIEIYAGSIERLYHNIFVAGEPANADGDAVDWNLYDSDGELVESRTATYNEPPGGDGSFYVQIGQDITNSYEFRSFNWEYEVDGEPVSTPHELLIVVNPYITFSQFESRYPSTHISRDEFMLIEPTVRKVIERYCNQTFSKEESTGYVVLGQNSDTLHLPKQIIDLNAVEVMDPHIDAGGNEIPYDIVEYVTFDENNRWAIRRRTSHAVERSLTPTNRHSFFRYPKRYRVVGDWGWDTVPGDVSHAAAILVNDYSFPDAKYREKYVKNFRFGEGRMEFGATGDETTGNANADMILSAYRNIAPAVI